MNKQYQSKIVEHLRRLGLGVIEPKNPRCGLCFDLCTKYRHVDSETLDGLFHRMGVRMPKGPITYPVEHPHLRNKTAYMRAMKTGSQWAGEYGLNRRALCLQMADFIELYGL